MAQLDPHAQHVGGPGQHHGSHRGHRWMVIACCVPMLLVAVALVLIGVANAGAIVFALACTAMMAVMMAGMGHGSGDKR